MAVIGRGLEALIISVWMAQQTYSAEKLMPKTSMTQKITGAYIYFNIIFFCLDFRDKSCGIESETGSKLAETT